MDDGAARESAARESRRMERAVERAIERMRAEAAARERSEPAIHPLAWSIWTALGCPAPE